MRNHLIVQWTLGAFCNTQEAHHVLSASVLSSYRLSNSFPLRHSISLGLNSVYSWRQSHSVFFPWRPPILNSIVKERSPVLSKHPLIVFLLCMWERAAGKNSESLYVCPRLNSLPDTVTAFTSWSRHGLLQMKVGIHVDWEMETEVWLVEM